MEGGFSTQVILAKAQAIEEGGYSPDVGIVVDLLQTKESFQASMVPVALQEQAGLYIYRFQVPKSAIYRFRLSARLPASTLCRRPSILSTRLIDYAISRAAAEDGICANHFQPLTNGNELHLGEADYLALLTHGQCACSTASSTTTTAFAAAAAAATRSSDPKVDGGCDKDPFGENRCREIGDVAANVGLSAKIVAVDRHGKPVALCEDLEWASGHFEHSGWASGELPQTIADEPEASFPDPDEPATGLDAPFAVGNSGGTGRRTAEEREAFLDRAKWSGVCASGEDGDCLQRRLHRYKTSMLLAPSDTEVEEEEKEELEGDLLLTSTGGLATTQDAWEDDSMEFNTRFRLGSLGVGAWPGLVPAGDDPLEHVSHPLPVLLSTGDDPLAHHSVLAPVEDEHLARAVPPRSVLSGDEPWASAFRPDSVPESVGEESRTSAVEAEAGVAREMRVFERCQRKNVHASDEDNILYASFDDRNTFHLPQLNDGCRRSLCSANLPLPSDVVIDILQVISDSTFFRLLEDGESEPRPGHPIDGSDFEQLLLSTFENGDPVPSTDFENVVQPHASKDKKQHKIMVGCSRTGIHQISSSDDDSEAASESSASSATRAATAAVGTDADVIVELSEDDAVRCDVTAESYRVDYKVRLRFWSRARRALLRAFQRIRDFLRGLLRSRRRAARQPSRSRRCRLSRPSWSGDAERVVCDDLSKV